MATKKCFLFFLSLCFLSAIRGQISDGEDHLLKQLDSVSHSSSISKYFAGLYYHTTLNAKDFFASSDGMTRDFMQRLEVRFGNYFFDAVNSYESGKSVSSVWATYYADSSLSELQYLLLGINAHINGDIWKALTTEFSLKEIETNKQEYFRYYEGLKKIYTDVYHTALDSEKKFRLLHQLSFGLDKWYGRMMLHRWRKRQMRLAILFFTNPKKFEKKNKRLQKKMGRINGMIKADL